MKDTVKLMLEGDFGFSPDIYSKNREILEDMNFVSESVRQLTGFTPDKVIVLSDGNNVYIEFANNLERLMEDGGYDLREALDMVMMHNHVAGAEPNIIIDESSVDRIDLDALIKEVGENHIFRK